MPSQPATPGQRQEPLTERDLARAISEGLAEALRASSMTQEVFSRDVLAFSDGGGVSKILSGTRTLALEKAKLLDAAGFKPLTGGSFEQLASAYRAVKGRGRPRRARYDVFLASPMASGQSYPEARRSAIELVRVIENHCAWTVYYAGKDIETDDEFDAPDVAFGENWGALHDAEMFVLFAPTLLVRPSSVWVEAGVALALGLRSTYFVPDPNALPYILQRAVLPSDRGGSELASSHWVESVDRAAGLIKRNGRRALQNM